jgi:transketolase
MVDIKALQIKAIEVRKRTLEIIYNASSGHTGGSLSSIDILVALYFHVLNIDPLHPDDMNRDRFIMSKGHSAEGYYCVLSSRGFFPDSLLDTYGKFNSLLSGHPTRLVPGVELNSGALGHGLSVGVGLALAAKRQKKNYQTYVLMGDGEHAEGSVMEAAATAGHYKLNNLIALIDRNYLQISGPTEEVLTMNNIAMKYEANGWHIIECDGHNMAEIIRVLTTIPSDLNKPAFILAHTVKGKGVSFIENNVVWHHKVPSKEQLRKAIMELNKKKEEIDG